MTKKQRKKLDDWNKKIQHLRSKGVEVRFMRECEWKTMVKNISETKTRMPRILKEDNEYSLLEAIKNDEVFGFAVCSISTDPKDIERMEKLGYLFPPIIQRRDMNFADANEVMKPFIKDKNKNKKFRTVIQTYNAQDQLVMTPIIRYKSWYHSFTDRVPKWCQVGSHKYFFRHYLEQGMKVTIKEFIQYEAGACFRPFADKVVQLRTEATYEKDDAKQLTAKLFGNSGKYFFFIQNNDYFSLREECGGCNKTSSAQINHR